MIACNVAIIAGRSICRSVPAWPFTADCACGHEITGDACRNCRTADLPGCLTCWQGASRHQCPVTFRPVAAEVPS